jgi:hypothetical protein
MRLYQCVILAQSSFSMWDSLLVMFGNGVMINDFGAAVKLRVSCECARKVMLLGACWYRGLWS